MRIWMKRLIVLCLAGLIVLAHVGLWSDPDLPADIKLRLTVLNALAWGVIGGGALVVSLWARSHGRPRQGDFSPPGPVDGSRGSAPPD